MTPSPRLRRGTAAATLAPLIAVLAACSAGDASAPAPPAPAPETTVTAPVSTPSPAATVDPAAVTCESLLPEELLSTFAASGWTVRDEPFRAGELELDEGHWCTWGDFGGESSENVQIYGWAPIDSDTASDAQSAMVADGWVREEAPDGVYITENPETTISTDPDGYGITLFFGDGWVTASDTKEGLLVITVPTP